MVAMHGVVLLSGGLDSTTVAAHAQAEGWDLRGLCVSYGQRHVREIEAAKAVAGALGIPLQVVDASFYAELAWNSSLTSEIALPASRPTAEMAATIPSTYVPIRNTFFLTLAAAALESWTLDLIDRGEDVRSLAPAIFIGANALDYSGYPDCRPEFYEAVTEALFRGSRLGAEFGLRIRVETPIIAMGKAEIAARAMELGAPVHLTWSCYAGEASPCGACDSCLLRAEGFRRAGLTDPAPA